MNETSVDRARSTRNRLLLSVPNLISSPSRRREAPCEGINSPRLFTPGETKALAKSKVHQLSRAWVTNGVGWEVILTDLKHMAGCHE
jgi:hypothetical protein